MPTCLMVRSVRFQCLKWLWCWSTCSFECDIAASSCIQIHRCGQVGSFQVIQLSLFRILVNKIGLLLNICFIFLSSHIVDVTRTLLRLIFNALNVISQELEVPSSTGRGLFPLFQLPLSTPSTFTVFLGLTSFLRQSTGVG